MARSIICFCGYCGKSFDRCPNQVKSGRAKHCSRRCANEHKKSAWRGRFRSRFQSKGANECWPWTGTLTHKGYGVMRRLGRQVEAHRIAFELTNGPIGNGLVVRHKCDNPQCVNPNHLETGTHTDNIRDRDKRKRTAFGERSGVSILTEATVRAIRADYSKDHSLKKLVAKHKISRNTIQAVVYRKTWRHLL